MEMLLIFIVVVVVLALLMRRNTAVATWLDSGTSPFEDWARQSFSRTFGVPAAFAAVTILMFHLTGYTRLGASIFANGFLLCILYSFAHTIGGRSRVRLAISMLFLTCLFGSIIGLALVMGLGL